MVSYWNPIATVPHNETVIVANFDAACLISGAPHVWSATYVTEWTDLDGSPVECDPMWCEASFASMNENGEPTHWTPMPELP